MSQNQLTARLRELATSDDKRSKTARLREAMPDVENTLAAGVKIETVLEALNENGFNLSLGSFKTMLYRLRLERGGKPQITTVAATIEPEVKPKTVQQKPRTTYQPPPPEVEEEEQDNQTSTNPADIDKIISSTPDLDALAKAAKKRK